MRKDCASKGIKGFVKETEYSGTSLHNSWRGMVQRCTYPKNNRYQNYGGRGIVVCEEWKKFPNFVEWALKNGYQEGLTIERVDSNGNYEPSNCRWATYKDQNNNKSNSRLITINGETHNFCEWADIFGIHRGTVTSRLSRGWDIEKALTTPIDKSKRNKRLKSVF